MSKMEDGVFFFASTTGLKLLVVIPGLLNLADMFMEHNRVYRRKSTVI